MKGCPMSIVHDEAVAVEVETFNEPYEPTPEDYEEYERWLALEQECEEGPAPDTALTLAGLAGHWAEFFRGLDTPGADWLAAEMRALAAEARLLNASTAEQFYDRRAALAHHHTLDCEARGAERARREERARYECEFRGALNVFRRDSL
jgi:hypothetical protein